MESLGRTNLHVTMKSAMTMAVVEATKDLIEITLDEQRIERTFDTVHVALEILIQILEHQVELGAK